MYADRRAPGVAHVALLVGPAVVGGVLLERSLRHRPVTHALATAATTWVVLGGTSLVREADGIGRLLEADDLPAARRAITALVSRDPAEMDQAAVTRACVESVAENTSDAVTGALVWGAVAGVPGLAAYRCINTLDAMIGYRNPRYARFGWAAARSDDLLNLIPARLTALLVAGLAPLLGGSPARVWRTVVRDAPAHPSPNGGVVEAAFAAALGVRLGGSNRYGGRLEDRGTLGDGAPPVVTDIARAATLSRYAGWAALAVGAAAALARPTGRRWRAAPAGPRRSRALPGRPCGRRWPRRHRRSRAR